MKTVIAPLMTLLLLGASCQSMSLLGVNGAACHSDDQCRGGELCFAEGCGDPGTGIVVEVESPTNGQPAQDIVLPSGFGAVQDFDLGSPLAINGEFQRERSTAPNPTDRTFYADPVVVRAVGRSLLVPGVSRIYETRFERPERGAFEMKLGAGTYALTATPGDRTLPPVSNGVQLQSGTLPPAVTFVFPSVEGAPALTGQLIKTMDTSLIPPQPILFSTVYSEQSLPVPGVDVQLIDGLTNQPLTQRFPVASNGEFAITLSPLAQSKSQLVLVASPREPGVAIPSKRFVLQTQATAPVALQYGDFGDEVEVTGTIFNSAGSPVVGAQIVLEGTVEGDGFFRSKIVETGPGGEFSVKTLPSKSGATFLLTVSPPPNALAAYAQQRVTVTVSSGSSKPVGTLSPSNITLPDRVLARGVVSEPSGKQAAGVRVRATFVPVTGDSKVLLEAAETTTDSDGTFTLYLDPGMWRFEYQGDDGSPLSSRMVGIQPNAVAVSLDGVELSWGRTINGTVSGVLGSRSLVPLPYSRLRFFRVKRAEGEASAILLGSTIADDRGRYQVVLPSVTPPKAP